MQRKKINLTAQFFAVAFAASFFAFLQAPRVFAAACKDGGGSCWQLDSQSDSCGSYESGGKLLVSYPAGDAACAAVYAQPVKCCKVGTVSSSGPAATSKGPDTGSGGASGPNTGSGTAFVNPLRFNSVEDFLSNFLVVMQRIIVTLSLVMIVYGALLYITSAGTSQMETGKKAIFAACIGLAIGIGAPSILKELSGILGWGTTNNATVNAAPTLSMIATNVLNFLLGVTGIIALIMLVIGALMYLTSAGDDKQVETGKKIFKYSLYGVIIAMSAMILVTQIASFFAKSSSTSAANSRTADPGSVDMTGL